MLNFKEFLNETGDSTYPIIEKSHVDGEHYYCAFKTENGRFGDVYIQVEDYDEDDNGDIFPSLWDVLFKIDGSMSVTGGGDAFKIFSTVIKAMEDWYKIEKPIGTIKFMAASGLDGKESRIKLYRTLLNKFAKKYHYQVIEKNSLNSVIFYMEQIGVNN